jgi:uncharacterized repeat protein (TIGR03803 family)
MEKFRLLKAACIIFVVCAATAIGSAAQTFTVFHNFDGTDGAAPFAGLVQAADGNFYGTTSGGGASSICHGLTPPGCGTVFQITPSGTLTVLHSFNNTDGAAPLARLVQATDGNFYGTTEAGHNVLRQ